MKQHHMVEEGDTLIVGVSGGADSVCLLSVLSELSKNMNLTIVVAHINHLFRETALRDEEYVQKLCDSLDVPCRITRADVSAMAREHKISFEEAGRNVRYAFFEELLEEYDADKIAVAHNQGDCAETVLFHLFRGSSVKGLGGISPVNGRIIRPLLNTSRKEIEVYLQNKQIAWQNDETNDSVEYTRNYIRHEIKPLAERMYTGVAGRIAEAAADLREAEDYLQVKTWEAYKQYCNMQDGGIFISDKMLSCEHNTIISRLIYHVLERIGGTARDLGKVHVQEIRNLFDMQSGRQISLPAGVVAYRSAEGVLVRKEGIKMPSDNGISAEVAILSAQELNAGEEISFELEGLGTVKAKLLFNVHLKNIPQKTYTKWFDYDKITKCAAFRKRLEGDYLVIHDDGGRKKLKEYFIQEKIPAYKRDEMWILTDDKHVMWIPGYRISAYYKITEETERVLEITIGGRESGKD